MPDNYVPVAIRRAVLLLAAGFCEYCKSPKKFSATPFEMEHIISLAEGGKTDFENIAYACRSCNGSKNIKIFGVDPISGKPIPLFNPRQQIWGEHFKWSEDFLKIIGFTQIGQATVIELKLNRLEHINLRRLLVKNGEHPPI